MTTFRNRMASALWIFMGIWMSFLCVMTWVVVRDGPPTGYSVSATWAVLFVFWLFGSAVSAWAGTHRTVQVDVAESGAVLVTWRSPFHAERRRVEAADVLRAAVVDGEDSEGDPYFTSRVTLADGATIDLAESHDRTAIEATTQQFNAVAGLRRGRSQPTLS